MDYQQKLLEDKRSTGQLLGGISPRKVDYMIAEKKLRICRIGRRVFVLRKSIEDYIKRNAE